MEIALWSFGLVLLGGATVRESWRRILNPPLLAIVLTLVLNFVIGPEHVPGFLRTTTRCSGSAPFRWTC